MHRRFRAQPADHFGVALRRGRGGEQLAYQPGIDGRAYRRRSFQEHQPTFAATASAQQLARRSHPPATDAEQTQDRQP
jgi:hypothetical protein